MKLKIGQKVLIKCIEPGTHARGYIFTEFMVKYWNEITEITEIIRNDSFLLKCTGKQVGWDIDWFSPLPENFLDDIDFEI
jgi:hypothetical protein